MAGTTDTDFNTQFDNMRQQFTNAYARSQQNVADFNAQQPRGASPFPQIPVEQDQTTPREALFRLHEVLTGQALDIMRAKNHDYASTADPFRNFRTFGLLGVLVRLSDKLARLRSFEEQGVTKVSDESITDTIVDIINYAVIFEAMRRGN